MKKLVKDEDDKQKRMLVEKPSQRYAIPAESMKIKGIKKRRLKALKPIEKSKEPPQWCYDYVNTITIDRWEKLTNH